MKLEEQLDLFVPGEARDPLLYGVYASSPVRDKVVPGHGTCSTEYVRGREARRLELSEVVAIANRNKECTLHKEGV